MKKNLQDLVDNDKLIFAARKIMLLTNFDRTEIINLILQNQAMNVTQIHTQLNFRQPDTSAHLQLMHRYGIVNRERRGSAIYYSINEKAIEEMAKISEELNKIS